MTRRVAEEVNSTKGPQSVRISFFDIEKAYPRVNREALWQLMELRGCSEKMIKICKCLHELTAYQVKYQGGLSSSWVPDKGLREGCPSSPPLFNIYHDAVMKDFRARRKRKASEMDMEPGLPWNVKVDGKLARTARHKVSGDEVKKTVLGDIMFADDTAIIGIEDEVHIAEKILEETMKDWDEKVNALKTERLRMSGQGRNEWDVRMPGEKDVVRHVGGHVAANGRQDVDTNRRIGKTIGTIKSLAKAWSIDTRKGRGIGSKVNINVRLAVTRAITIPGLTTFGRSRKWSKLELKRLQQVANYAVRRCFGMDRFLMQEHHISDAMMYQAAGWERIDEFIKKQAMVFLGHIARMEIDRYPKMALFGWWRGQEGNNKFHATQPKFLEKVVTEAGIHKLDWFRVAQHRKEWRNIIDKAFPKTLRTKTMIREVRDWRPGDKLPITRETRNTTGIGAAQFGRSGNIANSCPVCQETFDDTVELYWHYDEMHSVRDPGVVTVLSFRCNDCKKYFARKKQIHTHACEAKAMQGKRMIVEVGGWLPVAHGPEREPPKAWSIATDGSGQKAVIDGKQREIAGWGAVVFRYPITTDRPEFILHAPVICEEWHPMWIGSREKTNNTGELTAIGEAMLWLLGEAPDDGTLPVEIRFDSKYAANIASGTWLPKSNEELAWKVRQITREVEEKRVIVWTHVYGHSGEHDNELADRAADMGARGKVSEQLRRWAGPIEENRVQDLNLIGVCKRCGKKMDIYELKEHAKTCNHRPAYCPENYELCRKCTAPIWAPRMLARNNHEKRCRGSDAANSTCEKCGETGFPISNGVSRKRVAHERWCKGPRNQASGNAGSAKAKTKPKAKIQAKSKAKAQPKPKALPKFLIKRKKDRAQARIQKAVQEANIEGLVGRERQDEIRKATVMRRPASYGKRMRVQ